MKINVINTMKKTALQDDFLFGISAKGTVDIITSDFELSLSKC